MENRYLLVVIDEECYNANMMRGARWEHAGQSRNSVSEHDISSFSMMRVEPLLKVTTLKYLIMAMEVHIRESDATAFAVIESVN